MLDCAVIDPVGHRISLILSPLVQQCPDHDGEDAEAQQRQGKLTHINSVGAGALTSENLADIDITPAFSNS